MKIGVYDKSGSEIVNSIVPASGGGPVTPAIYYRNNTDRLNPRLYLMKSSESSNLADTFPHSYKETVTVKTLLCSTKLTQNVDLMSLLNWRAIPDRIPDILGCIMKT